MKTKTNARILAWLLSICLIAGILPAMPANYAQAAGELVYDFSKVASSDVVKGVATYSLYYFTDNSANYSKGTFIPGSADGIADYETTKELGSDPFEIFDATKTSKTYVAFHTNNLGLALGTVANGYGTTVLMNLKIEQSGWYTLAHSINNASGATNELKFALYPNTENTIAGVLPLFQDTFTGKSGANTCTSNNGKAVYLNSEYTYVAEYSAMGATGGTGGNYYILNLTATPAAAPALAASGNVNAEYTVGDAATTVSYTVDGTAPSVSAVSDNAAVDVSANGSAVTFTPSAAGTANVTVTANYMGGAVTKEYTITVKEKEKPLPANAAKFGNFGAYFTLNGDGTYDVTFLSAIDSLDYEKVGFKVTVNGNEDTTEVVNAYSSVAVYNNTSETYDFVTAETFGLDSGFVFFDSVENVAPGASVTFQPYAINLDGEEILGSTFTATIPE